MNLKLRNKIYKFMIVLILLLIWEIVAQWVSNPKVLPGIYYILSESIPSIAFFSGYSRASYSAAFITILSHSLITFIRIIIGLVMGTILGIIYGLAIHYFKKEQRGNALVLMLVRNIPLFGLIPLFLYWFGGKEYGIIIYIIFAVFIVIATNSYEATFNVPSKYIDQARLLGATRYDVFRTIIFFCIQPEMIGGLRNVLGLSWAFSLGAEYLSAQSGIGYLLYQSYLYADMGKIIVFALLYAFYGILTYMIAKQTLFSYIIRWV